jgi:hypothetical protein
LHHRGAALPERVQTGVEQRPRAGAAPLVVCGIRLLELREDRAQVRVRLLDGDAGLQAPEREQEQAAPLLVPVEVRLHDAVHRHRHPHRRPGAEEGAGEPFARHADHREGRAVEDQRLAHDGGVRPQAALPEPVAQHRDRRRPPVLLGQEAAAERRLRPEQREVVARDHLRGDLLGCGAARPVQLREGDRRHLREDLVLVAQVLVVEVRQRQLARIPLVAHVHRREPAGILHRDRLQHRRVDQAEDGGVGADAERQRQHRHRREDRAPGEEPERVSKVVEHGKKGGRKKEEG